jgi:hypothetical protein
MKQTFYMPELATLRFFAFLSVFGCHTALDCGMAVTALTRVGGYGVDVFFALSAYLLTELMLREKEATGGLNSQGVLCPPRPAHPAALLLVPGGRVHRLSPAAAGDHANGGFHAARNAHQ